MKYTVYIKDKKKATLTIEAENEFDAVQKARRMVRDGHCDRLLKSNGVVVTGAVPLKND